MTDYPEHDKLAEVVDIDQIRLEQEKRAMLEEIQARPLQERGTAVWLTVTQTMIDEGVYLNCNLCPVALAFLALPDVRSAVVTRDRIFLVFPTSVPSGRSGHRLPGSGSSAGSTSSSRSDRPGSSCRRR